MEEEEDSKFFIVTIGFKGGNTFIGRFSKFEGGLTKMRWESAPNDTYPYILSFLRLEEVAYWGARLDD